MMRLRARLAMLVAAGSIVLGSCGREPTGLARGRGALALAPRFASVLAGDLVQVATVRVRLVRPAGSVAVLDTVISFPAGQDSVAVTLSVPLDSPEETFLLSLAMATAAGDTVFRSGPTSVLASTNPLLPAIASPVVEYVGTGASATGVRFVSPPATTGFNSLVPLVAEAFDGQGAAIAGTPIGFELVTAADSVRGTFADAAVGSLATRTVRGPLPIRAVLLTGQAAQHTIEIVAVADGLQVVSGSAQSAIVGGTLPAPLVARVIAADGLGVAGVEVEFTVAHGTDTLAVVRDTSDAQGLVSHVAVMDTLPGAHAITARVVGQAFAPATFTATGTVGPAAALRFGVQPSDVATGATMTPAVTATAVDLFGNPVATFTGTVTLAMLDNPQAATLGGTVTRAAVGGVATFNDLTLTGIGTGLTLLASAPGLASDTSATFDITTGPPSRLAILVEPVASVAGSTFATAIQVAVRDANGVTIPTATDAVTIALLANPGGATLQGTTTVAAVGGVATFANLRIDQAATGYTLAVTSGALASDTTASFDVAAAAVSAVAFSVQPPLTATAATPFAVSVAARDAFGNTVTGFTGAVTVAIGANPAGGTLSGVTTVPAVAGVAAFTGLSIDNIGAGYTLDASSPGLTGGTSNAFEVAVPALVNAWINTSGGNWSSATNWSRGTVPAAGETVWIKQSGTYAVIFDVATSVGRIELGGSSGTQSLDITTGTMTMTDSVLVGAAAEVTLSGGSLGGTGAMRVDGAFTWSGGGMNGAGAIVRIAPAGTITVSGTTTRGLSNVAIEIAGVGTWTGTHNINSGSAAAIRVLAGGQLDIQGDPSYLYNLGGAVSQFTNSGTVLRSVGGGTATIGAALDNDGAVQVTSGQLRFTGGSVAGESAGTITVGAGATLEFGGGNFTFGAASGVSGAGTVEVSGGVMTATGPWSLAGTLLVNGGTLNFSTASSSVATVTVESGVLGGATGGVLAATTSFTFTGGSLGGAGGTVHVASGAALLISGTTTRSINNAVLELAGTGSWTGTHSINSGAGAVFRVLSGGTLDIQGDPSFLYNLGGVASQFTNVGTVLRSTSAGSSTFNVLIDNDGVWTVTSGTHRLTLGSAAGASEGTFTAAPGGTLEFAGGTFALGAASAVNGAGIIAASGGTVNASAPWSVTGTLVVSGGVVNYGAATGSVANVEMDAGSLGGPATGVLTVPTSLTWTGGGFQGSGGTVRVPVGGVLTISGTATRSVNGARLELAGTGIWSGSHNVNSGTGARFRVLAGGALEIQGDPSMSYNLGGAASRFENLGTITRSTSTGAADLFVAVTDSGTTTIASGLLALHGGGILAGAHSVSAGTELQLAGGTFGMAPSFSVAGAGSVALVGSTLNGLAAGDTVRIENLRAITGSLAPATGGTVRVSSLFTWEANAELSGGGATYIPVGATAVFSGTASRSLNGHAIEIDGGAVWADDLNMNSGSGARIRIRPAGTMSISAPVASAPAFLYNLGGAQSRLEVEGALAMSTAATFTVSAFVQLDGTLAISDGTFEIFGGSALVSDAFVGPTGLLSLASGTHTVAHGFIASGPGLTRLGGGTLVTSSAVDTAEFARLDLTAGTLAPSGAIVVSDHFDWSANGPIGGSGRVIVTDTLLISGTASRSLTGSTLQVEGVARYAGSNNINSGSGARIETRPGATFEWTGSGDLLYNLGGAATTFENLGTFEFSGTAATSVTVIDTLGSAFHVGSGTLTLFGDTRLGGAPLLDGTLEVGGGTLSLRSGASLSGVTGRVLLSNGTLTTDSAATAIARLDIEGGTLTHEGELTIATGLNWNGGSITSNTVGLGGSTVIPASASFVINGTASRTYSGTHTLDLRSGSVVIHAASGNINAGSGATILNATTFDKQGSGSILYNLGGAASVFRNLASGVLASSGASTGTITWDLENQGGQLVASGDTLRLHGGSTGAFTGSFVAALNPIELANATFTLTGPLNVTGANGGLRLENAAFVMGGNTVTIAGDLVTAAGTLLPMTDVNAVLDVRGDITFGGGTSTLSAGLLALGGDFTQGGGAANAFAPTGTHRTRFDGTAVQAVSFASTFSFFNIVELGTPTTSGRISLLTNATVADLRDTTAAISDTIFSPANATLSAGVATLRTTVFDGAELSLTSATGVHQLETIRFQNMDPTATFFRVQRNAGSDVTFAGATFATTPTTGYYVAVHQLTGTTFPVVLSVTAPVTPTSPAGRYLRTSDTVQQPNVIWAGVTNP